MAREALVLALALVAAFSGCVNAVVPVAPAQAAPETGPLRASETALWPDPQNAPHPAWNWPTLAYPAEGGEVPTWWEPIPPAAVPDEITGLEHVKRAPAGLRGAGIALFGKLVVLPGFSADSHVISLADPAAPEVLSTIPGRHRGAAIIPYPSGRLVTVFATAGTLEFWDITDPRQPTPTMVIQPTGASHKVGVVPGTAIVYNANTDGQGSVIGIYDASDPENVVKVRDFQGGFGCHHVYFWISVAEDKYRAICAAIQATQILDIEDPRDPKVVVNVPVHHGIPGTPSTAASPARLSHFAILSADGRTLIVGDETGGGAAPGCDAHVEALGLTASGPLGDLYFYDLTEETRPVLRGWFNPGAHYLANLAIPGTCTAHHGRLVPDPQGERDLLVMGYYSAGVVLIDFTDAANPRLVDQWATGTTTWETWYANGYIVTGDLSRGLDVLRLV